MRKNKGMTLFIAISIMSILLFISFAVINITVKSTLFASSGRDSQFAFYAADAGLECAVYWDSKYISGYQDGYPIYRSAFDPSAGGSSISCGGSSMATGQIITGTTTSITTRIGGGGPSNLTSIFGFVLNQGLTPALYCTIVTVTKNNDGTTYVKSRGYNTCDTTNLRRIERGVEVTY